MAQFRLSLTIASRSATRSVVAMAAYRAGCRLHDNRSGKVHDYARRRGVVYAEIVLPHNAPAWAGDREQLWNRVEEREGRSDAQLAREVLLSLPHELNGNQRRDLALMFAQHMATEYGFAVDVAIHAPSEQGDARNHHAHLLVTSRAFDAGRKSGWAKTKDRRLDAIAMRRAGTRNGVEDLREVWQAMQNAALTRADVRDAGGDRVQVDRRSYARQGLDIQAGLHDGPEATAFKRRRTARLQIRTKVRGRGPRRERLFFKPRHTAEAIRAFNQELAASALDEKPPSSIAEARLMKARLAKRLNTDPLPTNLSFRKDAFKEDASQSYPRATPPWRWRGLDALNQELAEPVEEERREEREGGKGRQPILLNTDPKPDDRVRTLPPQPEQQPYERSR